LPPPGSQLPCLGVQVRDQDPILPNKLFPILRIFVRISYKLV
jgi:hypothetical protein